MIGALIGAGLSVAGSVAGGIAARKAARRQKRLLRQQQRENEDWYNRRYNEDATQRADAQRLLRITEDNIKRRNKSAAGTQAVMGGSEASVAATKEANNKALADTVSQISAQGEARKDAIEADYRGRKADLSAQQAGMQAQKGANIASAIQGVTGAAGGIANALDSIPQSRAVSKGSAEPEMEHGLSSDSAKSLLDAANAADVDHLDGLEIGGIDEIKIGGK